MARALLLGGYRFGAVDLQSATLTSDTTPVLALASASYLDATVQEPLVRYLTAGGRLLLCGEVPSYDLERRSCTVLRDALGLSPRGLRLGDHAYFLSVCAQGWAAPRPEVRVSVRPVLRRVTGRHGAVRLRLRRGLRVRHRRRRRPGGRHHHRLSRQRHRLLPHGREGTGRHTRARPRRRPSEPAHHLGRATTTASVSSTR